MAHRHSRAIATLVLFVITSLLAARDSHAVDLFFQQSNLVSSVQGLAPVTDPNLKNPWGISFAPTSPFWVSNQATQTVTLYNGSGAIQSLVVTIPGTGPTGQVFNPTAEFPLGNGGDAFFLFATLDGRIAGWNPAAGTNGITMVDSPVASYTGLAMSAAGSSSRLYAADFAGAKIDAFDANFGETTLPGSFTDPNLPAGFSPYNIQNFGGTLFVAYENETNGGGVINAFDTNGNLIRRVTSNAGGGVLDDPWGMTIAPAGFGQFAGALLVGNVGDGRISAYDPATGQFLGQLKDQNGAPIANPGLWGLTFGNGGNGGDPNTLYFAAGIQNQTQGLFAAINGVPVPESACSAAAALVAIGVFARSRRALRLTQR